MATDQEMIERIAKLSTAIEQQKIIATDKRGYYSPPSSRGRPNYAPFRGRGGHMSFSNTAPRNPKTPYYPVNGSNKYINPATTRPLATGYISPPMKATHNRTLAVNSLPATLKNYNKKLIINDKDNKSTDIATGRKQVAIDGVDFVVKGKKLIRKDLFDSNMTKTNLIMANSTTPKVLVRKSIKSLKRRDKNKNMVVGNAPAIKRSSTKVGVRRPHQKGNMVFVRGPEGYVRQGRSGKSLVLNTHKPTIKKPRYCGFFTRYGKCPNGARCPFVHDSNRRAVCPRFLQNRCKKTPSECRLSHTPNPHIMPHCVHFQKGHCTNDPCMYAHVLVGRDAPVCKAFAMEGYCPKGLECDEKHVHVCPEFADTGKCSNANCRLPHVARRTANNSQEKQAAGIVRLGSWVSPQYFHAQKVAKAEKRKAMEEAVATRVWTRPALVQEVKEHVREKEEQCGFVRLFDDSDDDDGWSQYERDNDIGLEESLRFRDDDGGEEEEEEEDEEEEDEEEEEEEEEEGEEEEQEEVDENQSLDQIVGDQDQDDESDQDNFYDAVEIESPTNDVNDQEGSYQEVYQETSDAEMSDS